MIDRHFFDQFPRPLPRDPDDLTRQWADAHEDDARQRAASIEAVAASHKITEAEGTDLDEIGKDFGSIGQRRGRGDEEYRALLLSISNAFEGRGTPTGMRFAIGAGVQAGYDEVEIAEHYDHLAYSLTLKDWIRHETTTVDMLADLADPSGVELYNPNPGSGVAYQYEDIGVEIGFSEGYREAIINAEDLGLSVELGEATASDPLPGFGAGQFDGEDAFGDAGEFGRAATGDELSTQGDESGEVESEGVEMWPSDSDADGDPDGSTAADDDTDADADTETDADTDET